MYFQEELGASRLHIVALIEKLPQILTLDLERKIRPNVREAPSTCYILSTSLTLTAACTVNQKPEGPALHLSWLSFAVDVSACHRSGAFARRMSCLVTTMGMR